MSDTCIILNPLNDSSSLVDSTLYSRTTKALEPIFTPYTTVSEIISTTIISILTIILTDENLTSLGKSVPDILDYSNSSILDFDNNIDKQLIDLIGLTDAEFEYIKDRVDNIRSKEAD